ncbi:MAG: hypothetical protein ACRDGN_03140 [bacterium]
MRIASITLGIVLILTAASGTAAAQVSQYQTTLQLRYWGANFGAGAGSITARDSASTWGITLRGDTRTNPWSFSARYDSMSVTPGNFAFNGASFWDVNAHYRFGANLNTYFGLFVGYGGISTRGAAAAQTGDTSGVRLGAEFLTRLPAGTYFTGDVAFGPSWSSNYSSFPGMAAGNTTDWRVAVGQEFAGGWGAELGWRYYTWTIPSSSGCPGGCNFEFSGVTAALTFRR